MHESWSDEGDIRFSSEIYFGIYQFGNEFFLNRMSFKRKQAHPQRGYDKTLIPGQLTPYSAPLLTPSKLIGNNNKKYNDTRRPILPINRFTFEFQNGRRMIDLLCATQP